MQVGMDKKKFRMGKFERKWDCTVAMPMQANAKDIVLNSFFECIFTPISRQFCTNLNSNVEPFSSTMQISTKEGKMKILRKWWGFGIEQSLSNYFFLISFYQFYWIMIIKVGLTKFSMALRSILPILVG